MFRDGDVGCGREVARTVELELQRAARRGIGNKPKYIVCDPQGPQTRRLQTVLAKLEPLLTERAEADSEYGLIVGLADKSRQNPLNRLGGAAGAGDQAMKAYFDVVLGAAELVAKAKPAKNTDIKVIRVSPFSDECIILISGSRLSELTRLEFMRAWKIIRNGIDLKKYEYTHEVEYRGGIEELKLDLDAFARILRHSGLIVACSSSFSKPELILPFTRGFVQRNITSLEEKELDFHDLLPPSFIAHGSGLAEVETPFNSSLTRKGKTEMDHGTYVEIRLKPEEDTLPLLACVGDRKEKWGTRKGFSEIFSKRFGMRGLNTFMGKAQANNLLTAIAQGVYDAATATGVTALPVSGCYLRYWINLPPDQAKKAVKTAIANKLKSVSHNCGFKPEVMTLDSVGVDLSEVRARFVLQSMGLEALPATVLGHVDFLINFLENVNPGIQHQIFADMAKKGHDGVKLLHTDERYLRLVRLACGFRRTMRDTEDFIWT
ncbi:MAG: hypothetical protein ABID61_06260, partial [Candidatus Micrarchaeota archaeon]